MCARLCVRKHSVGVWYGPKKTDSAELTADCRAIQCTHTHTHVHVCACYVAVLSERERESGRDKQRHINKGKERGGGCETERETNGRAVRGRAC